MRRDAYCRHHAREARLNIAMAKGHLSALSGDVPAISAFEGKADMTFCGAHVGF
jgi:hypothetical protein